MRASKRASRGRDRGRRRRENPKWTSHGAGSQTWGSTPQPEIMTWVQTESWSLSQLSHPRRPCTLFKFKGSSGGQEKLQSEDPGLNPFFAIIFCVGDLEQFPARSALTLSNSMKATWIPFLESNLASCSYTYSLRKILSLGGGDDYTQRHTSLCYW